MRVRRRSAKYDVRRSPGPVAKQARSGSKRAGLDGHGILRRRQRAVSRDPQGRALGPKTSRWCRVGAETGVSDHSIEIRLEDLTIRAEGLPGLEGPPPAPAAFPWGLAAGGSAGLALLGAAVWWLAARKRSGKNAPAPVRKPVKR